MTLLSEKDQNMKTPQQSSKQSDFHNLNNKLMSQKGRRILSIWKGCRTRYVHSRLDTVSFTPPTVAAKTFRHSTHSQWSDRNHCQWLQLEYSCSQNFLPNTQSSLNPACWCVCFNLVIGNNIPYFSFKYSSSPVYLVFGYPDQLF